MSDTPAFLTRANEVLLNVYQYWPVQFKKGKGVYLYDTDGKKYLDFGAGIAVSSLGHGHPKLTKAIRDQAKDLLLDLCYVAGPARIKAAEDMLSRSDFDQIFFCNSGAEAVESALKTARKWAKETKGDDCTEIIYVKGSFHGRTMFALSVIGQEDYRKGFAPFVPGTHEAEFNNLDSFKKIIDERGGDKIASIILEPVLGEGGIQPATLDFLEGLRALCNTHDIALIFDEVQCGIGRTGKLHAYQQYGVVPDLITWAKGMGGGFPVGAFAGKRRFTSHITHGNHGGTYGGNPLSSRVISTVVTTIAEPKFLKNVEKTGKVLKDGLNDIARKTNRISNIRGMGMMLAADYEGGNVKDLIKACLKEGLIVLSCGNNSLRIVPPLTLTPKEAKKGLAILETVLEAQKI